MSENKAKLNRTMTPGQMEMIAIGGTIGSGLFMGATSTIKWTGPSVLLAYAFVGLVLYGVMRALGELILVQELVPLRITVQSIFIQLLDI